MKRKILATAIAALTAATCAAGLTACTPDKNGRPQPTALENAYENYRQTQNMTVTVTDSRTVKYGDDYSATVKIDYAHKAAYSKKIRTHVDNLNNTHRMSYEHYYEITSKPGFNIYSIYNDMVEDEDTANWNITDRSDLFNLPTANSDPQKFEIQLLTDFVNDCIPSHTLTDTSWRESENAEFNCSSLDVMRNSFTASAGGYTADVYFCINSSNGATYTPYACSVTIKLDTQDRFSNIVIDFGANGKISAEYVYGNTTVTIPEEAKNANKNH
ncbi:MAG: hypothetical protein K2N22_02950 [Clostridia bacterium]|nr:hypothetical protein [Clostridia bacterium]